MRFYTNHLKSKFGFYDGDALIELDLADGAYHKDVLAEVIIKKVAPKMIPEVSVYKISSIHSPIRIESVNGVCFDEIEEDILFSPPYVDVSEDEIFEISMGCVK